MTKKGRKKKLGLYMERARRGQGMSMPSPTSKLEAPAQAQVGPKLACPRLARVEMMETRQSPSLTYIIEKEKKIFSDNVLGCSSTSVVISPFMRGHLFGSPRLRPLPLPYNYLCVRAGLGLGLSLIESWSDASIKQAK